jgi:hypothetical protein
MMRVTKIIGSIVAVGIAFVALTATTESRAGDESLLKVSCSGGNASVSSTSKDWHINAAAPWKWTATADPMDTKPIAKKGDVSDTAANFSGGTCGTGFIKAYVCQNGGSSCKGPIAVAAK